MRVGLVLSLSLGYLALTSMALGDEDDFPLEPGDFTSPRATLQTFLDTTNFIAEQIARNAVVDRRRIRQDIERALRCLDLGEQPRYLQDEVGREAAVCLKEILDRVPFPPGTTSPAPRRSSSPGSD